MADNKISEEMKYSVDLLNEYFANKLEFHVNYDGAYFQLYAYTLPNREKRYEFIIEKDGNLFSYFVSYFVLGVDASVSYLVPPNK